MLDNRRSPLRTTYVLMETSAALPVAFTDKARQMKAFLVKQVVEHVCLFGIVKDVSRILMCVLALYWIFDSLHQLLFR